VLAGEGRLLAPGAEDNALVKVVIDGSCPRGVLFELPGGEAPISHARCDVVAAMVEGFVQYFRLWSRDRSAPGHAPPL
jgi:hypothetical protein